MTRRATSPILSELKSASSPAGQIKALRDLKNELIGHEQKKELWVGMGVLTPLARVLDLQKGGGKKKNRDFDAPDDQINHDSVETNGVEAQLQAIIVLGSLAYGQ